MTPPSLTDQLCASCGLCCDGTFLEDVELEHEQEALGLESMGLELDTDGDSVLPLPCCALKGTRCTIYAHRPATCRGFECNLLQQARREEVSVAEAQDIIAQTQHQTAIVRDLCKSILGSQTQGSLREMCMAAFEQEESPNTSSLAEAMEGLEATVHQYFMDEYAN